MGEQPPEKFIGDGIIVQIFSMVYIATCITMSSLSVGMDDGGSFPHPYSYTGFILAIFLFTQQFSRWYVTRIVQKTGVTRNNIVDVLTKSVIGSVVWPWSCRIGMMWCIPGAILTGLGGVNCDKTTDPDTGNVTIKNDCYYDIEGDHGSMYKGFAICLIVIHCISFVHLLIHNCPVKSVLDSIKEDPKPKPVPKKQKKQTPKPATPSASASGTPSNAANSDATNKSATNKSTQRDIEIQKRKEELDKRAAEIDKREREVAKREQIATQALLVPPPPSYEELTMVENHI